MAGAASPAGGLRASLTRAAARLTTPVGYLGILGGLQVVLLWVLRERYGIWLALTSTVGLFALLLLLITAVYASPMITLYLWSGRTDIQFLAIVLLTLTLLARGHPTLAAGALGIAVALKPFAWMAVPFLLLVLLIRWRAQHSRREVVTSLVAQAVTPIATILPFFVANPRGFWTDVVLYTSGGVADAYPIAGYGFGNLLYTLHIIARRTDTFPFLIFQLAAALPVLWLTARAFLRRPTIGRWMAGYAGVLLAFTFFARFFNDNYAAVVITLFLCVLPLGGLSFAPAPAVEAERLSA